ncbi:MAG: phasin family protein [Alphaproteobacteria bacterium]|nr:phasin family protein [Alphaproteobacteria bacterium]
MAKAKKTTGRAKAQKAEVNFDIDGVRNQATHFVARVQDGLRDAGDAFREAGETFGGEGRKVALKIVANAQDNVVHSFEALRDTLQAETFAEAVRIQQHALTEMVRRSIRQFREVTEIVGESSTKSLKPISKFVATVRRAA